MIFLYFFFSFFLFIFHTSFHHITANFEKKEGCSCKLAIFTRRTIFFKSCFFWALYSFWVNCLFFFSWKADQAIWVFQLSSEFIACTCLPRSNCCIRDYSRNIGNSPFNATKGSRTRLGWIGSLRYESVPPEKRYSVDLSHAVRVL